MSFYAFRLDTITCKNPRGKIPDSDIVTFSVFRNQVECGRGAGFFPDMAAPGAGFTGNVPAQAVTPDIRSGMSKDWIIGPLEIAPGDLIQVVYSGSNTSDSEALDGQDQAKIELKLLDAITSAVVGAVGGPVGSAVTTVLGLIGDPVGRFLGFTPQGPCNGLVFSDTIEFSGAGLDRLPFEPPTVSHSSSSPPGASEVSFTHSYTDEATHDSATCGEIAHTEVSFSVLHMPSLSVAYWAKELFPGVILRHGLKQLTAAESTVSLRSLLLRL